MNSENRKTSKRYVLILKLTDKLDLSRGEKSIALSNLSIYYTWKIIKSSYNNNRFEISTTTWNNKFELPVRLHSILIFKIILSIFQEKQQKTMIIYE